MLAVLRAFGELGECVDVIGLLCGEGFFVGGGVGSGHQALLSRVYGIFGYVGNPDIATHLC